MTEHTNGSYTLINWDALAAEVHADNVAKGFWPEEGRNFGEMIALAHSELSEASEAWDGDLIADDKCPQHLNVYVEIADCMIRLLDTMNYTGAKVNTLNVEDYRGGDFGVSALMDMDVNLMLVNKKLSAALERHRKNDIDGMNGNLEDAFMFCLAMLTDYEQDALVIINDKLAYNRSRPFKHGKKY